MERRGLLAAVLMCLEIVWICAAHAEAVGAAVLGSYLSQANAEQAVVRAQRKLTNRSIRFEIRKADVAGRVWFRVLAYDGQGHIDGRELVARVSRVGYEGAWFMAAAGPHRARVEPRQVEDVALQASELQPVQIIPGSVREGIKGKPSARVFLGGSGPAASLLDPAGVHPVKVIETLEGVERHRFDIPGFAEAAVEVSLDGRLDEVFWQSIPYYDEFMVAVPDLGARGEHETHVRFFTTEKGLYVGAIMYQPPDTLVSRYSVRDDFLDRDSFGVSLDTSGEGLVGYWFMIALSGNVQDGKILPERNYSRDWDGPWIGKSALREDGWSVEAFFPWSMMNMPEVDGRRSIGVLANRQVSHKNQRYQWPGFPYSSARFLSAFNEVGVTGVEPVPLLAAIPYASMTLDEANADDELRVGADISWKPSPTLEGTLSLNPDFGAVEADDVVLNLTASETFFPGKNFNVSGLGVCSVSIIVNN